VGKRWRTFREDRRGAYDVIQFALIVPIFIIILYGSYELLKLVSIRQALDTGTFQAARYLSVYHKYYYDALYNRVGADDTQQALRLIAQSLDDNPFITAAVQPQLEVHFYNGSGLEISSPVDFDCTHIQGALHDPNNSSLIFTVRAQLRMVWQTSVLGLTLTPLRLTSSHTAVVDCGPWFPPPNPTPTPTPTTVPAPAPGGRGG
jgi:hypothetical protein